MCSLFGICAYEGEENEKIHEKMYGSIAVRSNVIWNVCECICGGQ